MEGLIFGILPFIKKGGEMGLTPSFLEGSALAPHAYSRSTVTQSLRNTQKITNFIL